MSDSPLHPGNSEIRQSPFAAISRYLILVLLVFAPLARAAVQPWAVTVLHLLTLGALTAFLIGKTLAGEWRWIRTPLDKPIVCLIGLCTVSALFSVHRPTSFWAMILLLNEIAVFYLVVNLFQTRDQRIRLLTVIFGVAAFLAVFGLVKLWGHNPFSWWNYPHQTGVLGHRVSATYGNANHLAGYMEMVIPLVLALFFARTRRFRRPVLACICVLLFAALALTLSRGGWASMAVGLIFFALVCFVDPAFRYKKHLAMACSGVFLAAVIALGSTQMAERVGAVMELDQTPSLVARSDIWRGILKMIGDYPALGAGPGTFADVYTRYQPPGHSARYFYGHNDYLQWISETGIFLVPILFWMIFVLYREGFRRYFSSDPQNRALALGGMGGITAIAFHSIFDFNLHMPANALMFAMLVALIASPAASR